MSEPAGSFVRGVIVGAFLVLAVTAAAVVVAGFLR